MVASWDAVDPLRHWTPTPTQERYLRSSARYRLLTSVNRGGKTACGCADLAWTLRGIHPYRPNYKNLVLIQFTTSRLQAAQVLGQKLFKHSELLLPGHEDAAQEPMIPAREIEKLNEPNVAGMKVPYELIMRNGNRLLFSWAGVDNVWKRLKGLRLDGAFVDEDSGSMQLFDELYPRLLDAQSDAARPGLGFFSWQATNTEANEAYDAIVDRCKQRVDGHEMFVIGKHENPAISVAAREGLRNVLSADAIRVRVDGDVTAGDLVAIYHKQWGDARHVLPAPYEVQPEDNLWVGYDPGVDHPMGMLVCAVNRHNPRRLHAVQAWNYRGETIERDADHLATWLRGRKLAGFVYDTNLKNRDRGGGPSVLTRFKELLHDRGISPLAGFWQSKKNHAPGIALVRHYLDPNPDDRTVPPLLVLSPPTPENGVGTLRRQLTAYRGREASKFTGPGGVVKKDDELVDAVRYLIMAQPAWNVDWACGRALDIATHRVANLDAIDTDNAVSLTMAPSTTSGPRFDFTARVFRSRSRDRRRGAWSERSL